MGKQQLGQEHVHHGEQYPQMKNHRQETSVHTHSCTRHPERLPTHPST